MFFENTGNASEFCRRKIIPKSKVTVLHDAGINLDEYPYTSSKYSVLENAVSLDDSNDKVHFLYLGRIMREKGIDELLGVIKILQVRYGSSVIILSAILNGR